MDADLRIAYALAENLLAGKSLSELTRIQIVLQTISSLVSAEIGCRRLNEVTESQSGPGK